MPFIDSFRTLREGAGLRKAAVAKAADLSDDTIDRIEKHKNCTIETLRSAINALNSLYYDRAQKSIDFQDVVTEKTRFGEGKSVVPLKSRKREM